ncbi:MAG: BREX-6 system phosphatase PglZ, partial [Deltaproteobacteria bacterium]
MTSPTGLLIATALEAELRGELQRHGIVVWLDRDAAYTTFVDALAARHRSGDFPHPVVAFRGSFLETMLALEPYGSGLDPSPLLIHVPGFNEETVRATPLLELYRAGARFRKSFDTLVRETARGIVTPADVDAFLATGPHTVEEADAWLSERDSEGRQGFAETLQRMGIPGVLDAIAVRAPTFFAHPFSDTEHDVLQAFLEKHTGVTANWNSFCPAPRDELREVTVGNAFVAYLLCVEYVDDLARAPILQHLRSLKSLSAPLLATCKELVQYLRKKHPERYVAFADDVEGQLQGEIAAIRAEDLGRIDTFRVEESRVLEAAILALRSGAWSRAAEWAKAREGDASFWLERDQTRRWAWTLVAEAAALGEAITSQPQPLHGAQTLDEAVERYVERGAAVDRAHRRFEQQRQSKLDPRMPHFGDLQEIVGQLRRVHRGWADQLARDWPTLCRSSGFL